MGLIETLLLGTYMYTTGIFLWFQRKYEKLVESMNSQFNLIHTNHLRHTEEALNEVRARVGLPPVKLTDD